MSTTQTDILDHEGDFRWDYLCCKDLVYPSPDDFKTTHVYKGGEVVLRHGTAATMHALCIAQKLKTPAEPASGRDPGMLQNAGFVLEPVTNDEGFFAARSAYHKESARREAEFKAMLIEREGLTGHPKAELLYSKAYERGHAQGLSAVANTFLDLADLIR